MVHQDSSPRRYRVQAVQILFDRGVRSQFHRIKYSAWPIYEKHVHVVKTGIKNGEHAKFLRIVVTSTIGFQTETESFCERVLRDLFWSRIMDFKLCTFLNARWRFFSNNFFLVLRTFLERFFNLVSF